MQSNFISKLITSADSNFDTGWVFICLFGLVLVWLGQQRSSICFFFFISTEVQVVFEEFLGKHRIMLLCFYYFEWSPFPFPDNI